MENIESYERQSFPPNLRTINNLNEPNKDIEFDIDVGDGYIHPYYADLYIKFEVIGRDAGGTFTAGSNIKLIDNFVPFLFSQVEVRKHGTVIDRIDYPGIASTAVATCLFSKPEVEFYKSGGLITDTKLQRKDESVLFPLRLLFGFFSNYKDIMWKGGLRITFKRNPNNDVLFYRWKTKKADGTYDDSSLAHPGKINITSMEMRMPIVEYESNYALKLKTEVLRQPRIPIQFHTYQCIQRHVEGSYFEFDVTTQFNSLQFDMPDFVIVLFQTDRNDNTQQKDGSKFDYCKVKNIYLKNGRNEIFPRENLNLNIEHSDYQKLYESYTAFKRVTQQNINMFYSPAEFIENRPMFVINTSKRKRVVVNERTNIKIVVDFQEAVANNTICSVILVAQVSFINDVKNERVLEQF